MTFQEPFRSSGGTESLVDNLADELGQVCTSSNGFWMKGFIISPVDHVHIPTPDSPSSFVFNVKHPPSLLKSVEPGRAADNSRIWCSVLIEIPSRLRDL